MSTIDRKYPFHSSKVTLADKTEYCVLYMDWDDGSNSFQGILGRDFWPLMCAFANDMYHTNFTFSTRPPLQERTPGERGLVKIELMTGATIKSRFKQGVDEVFARVCLKVD